MTWKAPTITIIVPANAIQPTQAVISVGCTFCRPEDWGTYDASPGLAVCDMSDPSVVGANDSSVRSRGLAHLIPGGREQRSDGYGSPHAEAARAPWSRA